MKAGFVSPRTEPVAVPQPPRKEVATPQLQSDSKSPAAAIPVTVVPASTESDIRRLTRIILSDIVIYSPDKADDAIRQARFADTYKADIEEGRKMIRSRFSAVPAAVEIFERSLEDLLAARRKELQEAASAL